MAVSRNLGHKVTTRLISWEQQVRDAEGSRWNLPIGKYFFGDANQYVFVEYPGNEAVTGPPDTGGGGGPTPPPAPVADDSYYSISFVFQGTGSCTAVSIATASAGNTYVSFNGANNYTDYAAYPTGSTANLYASFVANEQFVVGEDGTILQASISSFDTSSVNWQLLASNTTANLYGVGYLGPGIGIAAYGAGGALVTFDGFSFDSWIARTTGTTATLRAGTYFYTAYAILIGDGGTIISSPTSGDGSAWTPVSSGTTNNLRAICQNNAYNNGTLTIAVGDNGTMIGAVGENLNSWSPIISGTSQNLYGIAYNGNQGFWTAVGANGTILYSPDGATWTAVTSGTTEDLLGVSYDAYGQNGIAVGAGGTLLHTGEGIIWSPA